MMPVIEKLFRAPYAMPNGLQVTAEGLWIVDQITDRVALVEIGPANDYGTTRLLRELPSASSNTSGLAYGDGTLWLAANGPAKLWRPARPTDAQQGEILKVDPASGATLARWPLPGGGGTHGVEFDRVEPGMLWLTTLRSQTLTQVRIADWSVQHVIPLPYTRAHGVVRRPDHLWVVHTADRALVKLRIDDGALLDELRVPADQPEPHCLSEFGDDLLYCDATSGWVVRVGVAHHR